MVQRVTYRRRHSYNTKSNKTKVVKTPGGKLVLHTLKKKASLPVCRETKRTLRGVGQHRPKELSRTRMSKRQKHVSRSYGGCLSHEAVRSRIIRAFLIEEQKIVKKVLKSQKEKK